MITIFNTENWKLRVYPWHSINLIPGLSIAPVGTEHEITGCLIQLTLFGCVISLMFPTRQQRYFISKMYGPLYSRKRKVWYRVQD